jgi:aryl-alcohol dehydrogenase-like predicted oxidoreductase
VVPAVGSVGLGCVSLGSAGRRLSDDVSLIHAAIDLGVTVFDTADVYGSGASEHVLGRALRGRRDGVVIATKGGFVFRDRRPAEQWARRRAKSLRAVAESRGAGPALSSGSGSYTQQDFSPQHLRGCVHASLRRLRTDRIDVFQLHGPETVRPDVIDQLADLVVAGDVACFGVGAGTVAAADDWVGVSGVGMVQVPFGVLDPEAAATTLPLARRHGIEVWVRGVLGGGLLGLAERDPTAVVDHPKRPLVEAIGRLATESGLDRYRLAMGFVHAHAADISTVLVGTSSPEHLRRNVEALAAPPLPDEILHALSELTLARVEER